MNELSLLVWGLRCISKPQHFQRTEWLCPSPCANQALTFRDMTFQQHLCHVSPCLLCSWLMMNYRGLHLFLWFLGFSIICEAIPYDSTRRREIWTKIKTLGTFLWNGSGANMGLDLTKDGDVFLQVPPWGPNRSSGYWQNHAADQNGPFMNLHHEVLFEASNITNSRWS